MRHPENILRDLPKPHGRPAIWAAIRALHLDVGRGGRGFTAREIWQDANHHQRGVETAEKTVRDYLDCLVAAKIIEVFAKVEHCEGSKGKWYKLLTDLGPQPPRVRRNGTLIKKGSATQRMWLALRVQGTFTYRELAFFASVADETARQYCHFLARAEYLRIVRKSKPGTLARYRFVRAKDTGPQAPMIQKIKALYDPNIRKIVYARNAGSAGQNGWEASL